MFSYTEARLSDALRMSQDLRFEDARELKACWGASAQAGLTQCLLNSHRAVAIKLMDKPAALLGVTSVRHRRYSYGIPWLLASDDFFRERKSIVTSSRPWIADLLRDYDFLSNMTDIRNDAHVRWLKWCGFIFGEVHEKQGIQGEDFVEFYLPNPDKGINAEEVEDFLSERTPASFKVLGESAELDVAMTLALLDAAPAWGRDELGKLVMLASQIEQIRMQEAACAQRLVSEFLRVLSDGKLRLQADLPDPGLEKLFLHIDMILLTIHGGGGSPANILTDTSRLEFQPYMTECRRQADEWLPEICLERFAGWVLGEITAYGKMNPAVGYKVLSYCNGLVANLREDAYGVRPQDLDNVLRQLLLKEKLESGQPLTFAYFMEKEKSIASRRVSHTQAVNDLSLLCGIFPLEAGVTVDLESLVAESRVDTVGEALKLAHGVFSRYVQVCIHGIKLGRIDTVIASRNFLTCALMTLYRKKLIQDDGLLSAWLGYRTLQLRCAHHFESGLVEHESGNLKQRVFNAMGKVENFLGSLLDESGLSHDYCGYIIPILQTPVIHQHSCASYALLWRLIAANNLDAGLSNLFQHGRLCATDSVTLDKAIRRRAQGLGLSGVREILVAEDARLSRSVKS